MTWVTATIRSGKDSLRYLTKLRDFIFNNLYRFCWNSGSVIRRGPIRLKSRNVRCSRNNRGQYSLTGVRRKVLLLGSAVGSAFLSGVQKILPCSAGLELFTEP